MWPDGQVIALGPSPLTLWDGSVVGEKAFGLELLLLELSEDLASHPVLVTQIQSELPADGRAGRPHGWADGRSSSAGVR